jgi:hypothetical protein
MMRVSSGGFRPIPVASDKVPLSPLGSSAYADIVVSESRFG